MTGHGRGPNDPGWSPGVVDVPAAPENYGRGRRGHRPERIVVHVSQGSLRSMDTWFRTARPRAPTSAHYGVGRNGEVHRYVGEEDTAYHAGDARVNLSSIGIEHEGTGADYAPTDLQLEASARLCAAICRRHGIVPSLRTIEPHSRHSATLCPGAFPLERYVEMVRRHVAPGVVDEVPRSDDLHVVVFNGTPQDFFRCLRVEEGRVVIRGVFASTRRGTKFDFREVEGRG